MGLNAKGVNFVALIASKVAQFTFPSGSWNHTVPWKEVSSAGISDGKSIETILGGPGTAVGVGVMVGVAVGVRVGSGVCVGV